ncbi:MAG: cbb3-type cytochrome c oxidase subunit 3 [Gammaproteobacteria bacterium]|nr:cbb3-type cytochrome c oxidase subunit 3 [Gammaproteobacteria bacterium]NNC98182.1 cbb3-type cytochrome c oxidase subunit 3 [Gammaproteobacteria bacterium]NNM14870.1 cbb3-type cytochrome c oxidase subunit 3 [Gammaproteobacteria bacterium]
MQNWLSSAIILVCLFAAFIALVIWAWSSKRRPDFQAASEMPLQDDIVPDLQESAGEYLEPEKNLSEQVKVNKL